MLPRPHRVETRTLNHGSIKSPIAGNEGGVILGRLRKWASQAGEIRFSDDAKNPTVSIQLIGIDTQSILERAKTEDNYGNRLRKLRELIFEQLEVEDNSQLFIEHKFDWRGTKRTCDIIFGPIMELPENSLMARGDSWKMLIDMPIPKAGTESGPADAQAWIEPYGPPAKSTHTIAWIPAHFTMKARHELGQLVIIDRVIKGNQFDSYASHLSIADRGQARSLLENQRSQLTEQIKALLLGAYGVAPDQAEMIDGGNFEPSRRAYSLESGLTLRPPVGANLGDAFANLLGQALSHQFLAHPDFKVDLNRPNLRKVLADLQKASQSSEPQPRIPIDKANRQLMREIAEPLQLGRMAEDHFVLDIDHWRTHFLRKRAAEGLPTITVRKLREWMDDPTPWGLTQEVQNLIILVFADRENYSFFEYGGPAEASLESIKSDWELRSVDLPPAEDWKVAHERASAMYGLVLPRVLNASNAERFASEVKRASDAVRVSCNQYQKLLLKRLDEWEIDPGNASRMLTANAVVALVEAIAAAKDSGVVQALACAEIANSVDAMGANLKKASELHQALELGTRWDLFKAIHTLADDPDDDRAAAARLLVESVAEAFASDEYAVGLRSRLVQREQDAIALLSPKREKEGIRTQRSQRADLSLAEARDVFRELERKLESEESARLDITWILRTRSKTS